MSIQQEEHLLVFYLHTCTGYRGIRKYIKTKVQFPDDQSTEKAVYLVIMNIEKKWSMRIHNSGLVLIS